MLILDIQSLKTGKNTVVLQSEAETIPGMFPEFYGIVTVQGVVEKHGNKYILNVEARCTAKLVCDRSNEEYDEEISVPISITFIKNNELYFQQKMEIEPESPFYIHEDAKQIDLSEYIRQELALALPMKRIAPQYRDKELPDIYPALREYFVDFRTVSVDERWQKLQQIQIEVFKNKDEG